jgi:mycothiol synthase
MDDRLTLPDGYTARPATMDDVDAVTALIAAAELEEDGKIEIEPEDIRSSWARASLNLATEVLLMHDGGELVAWAEVDKGRRADADVRPDRRGIGIGTALLSWAERRAREVGSARIGQTFTDANEGAADLFRRNGYAPLWESWVLEISLEQDPPAPGSPDGIELRPYEPGNDDPGAYEVIETAFSEWEDRTPTSFEDWLAMIPGHGAFVPDVSRVALDSDRIVGVAIAFDYVDVEGWVQQLAVERSYRNRGIASALLQDVFRGFRARGAPACGVNTDSRTGALSLYEHVGMHVRRSYTHWAKDLRAD